MGSCRLIENHNWWLMGDNDVRVIRYQFFRMVIGQSEELHSTNLTSAILQEMDIGRQVFNGFCIPQIQVVIACDKDFVRVRQSYEPIQKVEHLALCAIMADVTAMNDDISFR